uniref:Uncharacterized protein n=1 Tax=viral metagenome TaxID=1070528 RepID=A0A6M3LXT3_9ZZZZ
MEIEGTEYSAEMVELFLKTKGKNDVLDLPRDWFEQHLITFKEGYDLGCADTKDCDNCEERMPDEPERDPNG